MWEVSAITKTHQFPPWMNAAFVQIVNSKIKALLILVTKGTSNQWMV